VLLSQSTVEKVLAFIEKLFLICSSAIHDMIIDNEHLLISSIGCHYTENISCYKRPGNSNMWSRHHWRMFMSNSSYVKPAAHKWPSMLFIV